MRHHIYYKIILAHVLGPYKHTRLPCLDVAMSCISKPWNYVTSRTCKHKQMKHTRQQCSTTRYTVNLIILRWYIQLVAKWCLNSDKILKGILIV